MLGHVVYRGDIRQIYLCRRRRGEFYLCFFGSLFQTLHSDGVFAEVCALFGFEVVDEPVYYLVVEVVAAEVCVAVGRFHFENAVAQLEYRYIECTTAEVEYGYFHIFLSSLVETVRQSCCRRLVDDTLYLESRYLARLFGSLTLSVGEVCRHCDDGFRYRCTEVIFGGLFHLLQYHCRYLLRSVQFTVDIYTRCVVVALYHFVWYAAYLFLYLVVGFAHKTLDGVNRVVCVRYCLTLGGVAHFTFAVFEESHYRWSGAFAFRVGYYHRFVAFQNSYARVGCS